MVRWFYGGGDRRPDLLCALQVNGDTETRVVSGVRSCEVFYVNRHLLSVRSHHNVSGSALRETRDSPATLTSCEQKKNGFDCLVSPVTSPRLHPLFSRARGSCGWAKTRPAYTQKSLSRTIDEPFSPTKNRIVSAVGVRLPCDDQNIFSGVSFMTRSHR